jgi:hypothetical protein
MDRRPSCVRPGCQGSTSAWLTYDYAEQRVWLDDSPSPDGGHQWPLCAGHAGRLRAPQGWTQHDRRATARRHYEPPESLVS